MLGTWDYSTLQAVDPKDLPYGHPAYSVYPEPDFFDNPTLETVKAQYIASSGEKTMSGAAADGYNQIALIAQGIEKAGKAEPAAVAKALEGADIEMLHGPSRVRKCDHLIEQPLIYGELAKANKEFPYPHIDGEPFDVSETYGPDEC
jgi:ABC-type branched-subunit amino acid transport system substrate-binding protein